MDGASAIVRVNGGGNEEFGEATQAQIPVLRFVWSMGQGTTTPVPQDDPEQGGTLHEELIFQRDSEGTWDWEDSALGVLYPDGNADIVGEPSDKEALQQWLATLL
jgi:hypothetical protein